MCIVSLVAAVVHCCKRPTHCKVDALTLCGPLQMPSAHALVVPAPCKCPHKRPTHLGYLALVSADEARTNRLLNHSQSQSCLQERYPSVMPSRNSLVLCSVVLWTVSVDLWLCITVTGGCWHAAQFGQPGPPPTPASRLYRVQQQKQLQPIAGMCLVALTFALEKHIFIQTIPFTLQSSIGYLSLQPSGLLLSCTVSRRCV